MHTGRESPHHSRRDAKPPGAIGGLRLRVSASRGGWAVAELFLPDGYGFVQHCAKPNNEPFGDDSNYPSIVILGMIYWVGPALTDLNGKQTPGILAYGNHRLGWILGHCTFKLATVWQHDPFFCASEAAGEALATAGSTGAGWSGMVMEHKWPWCIIKIIKLQSFGGMDFQASDGFMDSSLEPSYETSIFLGWGNLFWISNWTVVTWSPRGHPFSHQLSG